MSKGRYLAIDFGDRRIGLAVSDFDKQIAFPRDTIQFKSEKEALAILRDFCEKEQIVKVILGLPVQMDGTVGERFIKTHEFGGHLKDAIDPVPVEFFDERLTTRRATQMLHEQGIQAKHHKKSIDMVSAQVILDAYLSSIQ